MFESSEAPMQRDELIEVQRVEIDKLRAALEAERTENKVLRERAAHHLGDLRALRDAVSELERGAA
jgi:hypothetical protein